MDNLQHGINYARIDPRVWVCGDLGLGFRVPDSWCMETPYAYNAGTFGAGFGWLMRFAVCAREVHCCLGLGGHSILL